MSEAMVKGAVETVMATYKARNGKEYRADIVGAAFLGKLSDLRETVYDQNGGVLNKANPGGGIKPNHARKLMVQILAKSREARHFKAEMALKAVPADFVAEDPIIMDNKIVLKFVRVKGLDEADGMTKALQKAKNTIAEKLIKAGKTPAEVDAILAVI